MMERVEAAYRALSRVLDPDLKLDLVTLKMVKSVTEINGILKVVVNLTTPSCPLKGKIEGDCREELTKEGLEPFEIELTAEVTSKRNLKEGVLPDVKNIIAVASGKGGVGKSTVAVNLALALSNHGNKVGILDADIYGPSVPLLLGVGAERPLVEKVNDKHLILPLEAHSLRVMSIGFLVDERQAIVWRGPMVSSALRQFATDVKWGELDYLILDLPPGTGDVHLTLAQAIPISGSIIVTTPQDVALSDVRKAIGMFRLDQIKIPILGVVENMSYFEPDDTPGKRYYIFGRKGGTMLAEEYGIPMLAEIPIVENIRISRIPDKALLGGHILLHNSYMQLAMDLERQIAIHNFHANHETKKLVL